MRKVKVRRPFSRVGLPLEVFSESKTLQAHLMECDINVILARYKTTGLVPGARAPLGYIDCTQLPVDLQDSMNKVLAAERAFGQISSDVRAEFNNDPVAFVKFCADPQNLEQLREWKLAPPAPKDPGPVRVEVVNGPAQPGPEPAKPA